MLILTWMYQKNNGVILLMSLKENARKLLEKYPMLNDKYVAYKWRERRVSYGEENPDKTFYVIRRAPSKVGLFSYVTICMGYIKYAVDHGYIPVVDLQNSENTYLEPKQVGKCNAWEFYFEQPCGYTLEDITHSKNIILGSGLLPKEYPGALMAQDEKKLYMWREYSKGYLKIKQDIQEKINQTYENLVRGARTVGVLCRGTDYTSSRPSRHPVQPNVSDVIEKTKEMLQENKCEYVFLATEDEEIFGTFKKVYGEKLKNIDAKRYHKEEIGNINDATNIRENDKYLRGLEYLIAIGVLAECDCLVAGCVGGTYGTLLLNKGYKEQYVFWLGCYM